MTRTAAGASGGTADMAGTADTRADREGKEGIRARMAQAVRPDGWTETNLGAKAIELWRSCHRRRPTLARAYRVDPIYRTAAIVWQQCTAFGPSARRQHLASCDRMKPV